jgi:hypothetical protein
MADASLAELCEDTICDHQSEGGPNVTHVRGTLLVASMETLKSAGHYERYLSLLAAPVRESLPFTLALSWVPVELAMAHYAACDGLALSEAELEGIGELVATRFADTFLGTLLRATRNAGVDAPWIAMRAQGRMWDRLYMGGRVRITRTGPKDALGEFQGIPLAHYPYFRSAYRAYYGGIARLFVRTAYVKVARSRDGSPSTLTLTASWA